MVEIQKKNHDDDNDDDGDDDDDDGDDDDDDEMGVPGPSTCFPGKIELNQPQTQN